MTYKDHRKSSVFDSKKGYDKYASFYDKKTVFLDSFEQRVIGKMLRCVKGRKILDAGCGTGRLIDKLLASGANVAAIDISPEMLRIAKKKFQNVKFVEGDVENLPFEDECFDIVIASFLIVHLKNPQKFFDEAYRVLKPGGIFIVTNINQRKAPKLKTAGGEEIVITSFYHIPKHVVSALKNSFFEIEEEKFVHEKSTWINQIVKAIKH